ncbi:MAG: hypothetical protein FDZ75_02990, partial [Actinobacteria bacterium]
MAEHAQNASDPRRSERTDSLLRAVIVVLVAALIGLALLFGYTIWQSGKEDSTATPAQRALQTYADAVRQ